MRASCARSARSVCLEWLLALIVAAAVASVWRGAWLIVDAYVLPQVPRASAGLSLGIGAALMALCLGSQPLLAAWARAHRELRLVWVVDAMYSYACSWVCVFVWRGVWAGWDQALGVGLDASPPRHGVAVSGLYSHAAGLSVLLGLGAMRSLSACPMLYVSDDAAPLFGAAAFPALGLRPLHRLRELPAPQSEGEWRAAVAVPTVADAMRFPTATE